MKQKFFIDPANKVLVLMNLKGWTSMYLQKFETFDKEKKHILKRCLLTVNIT